jgi:membrane associated rhomboid family serine protease
MIPISDALKPRSFPVINLLLIGINTFVFLFEISLRPEVLIRVINTFGMVPANLPLTQLSLLLEDPFPLLTLITGSFLHNGWFHFLTNIWVLHIFGDNVEGRMGHARYLLFYLMSGAAANILEAAVTSSSTNPVIGASGAVAGVMSAYFILFPGARITALIFFFPWFIRVPAALFLGFWFFSQVFSGFFSLTLPENAAAGGTAWWAHIGGFLFGLLVARFFSDPNLRNEASEDLMDHLV